MRETQGPLTPTLQIFITSLCDKSCAGCFYATNLRPKALPVVRPDTGHMPIDQYRAHVDRYLSPLGIEKVNLLGGEPLLHPDLKEILAWNRSLGLRTTVYTNGTQLDRLVGWDLTDVTVRVGVLGLNRGEKRLREVPIVPFPLDICYMTRKQNRSELLPCIEYAKTHFHVREFMISNIVDYEHTRQVWSEPHPVCLSRAEYLEVCEEVSQIPTPFPVSISKRGVVGEQGRIQQCRFLNILHDGQTCLCPFDIPLPDRHETDPVGQFGRACTKGTECFFQKHYVGRSASTCLAHEAGR